MKKLFFLFSFLGALLPSLSAQEGISKMEFEQIIDYVNCELTKFYIGTLNGPDESENFQKIRNKLDQNTIDSPITYNQLVALISEDFSRTLGNLTNIIEERKVRYDAKLEATELLNLALSKGDISESLFNILEERVISLRDELEPSGINLPVSEIPHYETESKTGTVFSQKLTFWNIIFGSLFFIGLILITVLINFQILKAKLKRQRFHTNQSIEKTVDNLFFDRFGNEKTLPVLEKQRIGSLEEKVNSLNREFFFIKNQQQELLERVSKTTRVENIPEIFSEKSNVLFFGSPSKESSFSDKQKTQAPTPSITMYKFNLESGNKARFSFEGDQISIKDAINSPYKYLEPVCESENSPFPGASKIRTIKEGTAVLFGTNWNVEQKALIRYE